MRSSSKEVGRVEVTPSLGSYREVVELSPCARWRMGIHSSLNGAMAGVELLEKVSGHLVREAPLRPTLEAAGGDAAADAPSVVSATTAGANQVCLEVPRDRQGCSGIGATGERRLGARPVITPVLDWRCRLPALATPKDVQSVVPTRIDREPWGTSKLQGDGISDGAARALCGHDAEGGCMRGSCGSRRHVDGHRVCAPYKCQS